MTDLSYYVNNDWFKIGRFGDKHIKHINIGLVAISSIFVLSLLFYGIMYSSTNFGVLDELEEYAKNYDASNGEFDRINLGMKIMPSYNTEKNALYMNHLNDIHRSSIPGSISIMENFKMNNSFFFINETALFFPKLLNKQENIPVGDSISMCLSMSWAPRERGMNYDIMKPVSNFPACKEAESGKFIWNSNDPLYGIDVPVWKQKSIEIDCTNDDDCNRYCESYNAQYVEGKNNKKCYSYDVIDSICLVIEYDAVTDEYKYAGGCYKDNSYYLMVPARANNVFYFNGVQIEVRNKKDPVIKAGEMSGCSYAFGQSWNFLSIILNTLLFASFVGLIVIAYYIYTYKQLNNNTLLNDTSIPEIENNKSLAENDKSLNRWHSNYDEKKKKLENQNSITSMKKEELANSIKISV